MIFLFVSAYLLLSSSFFFFRVAFRDLLFSVSFFVQGACVPVWEYFEKKGRKK